LIGPDSETIVSYKSGMANIAPSSASISVSRSRGRPREFDMEDALDKAVGIFCARGYHATSIGDLTEAMQLAQGSVYKAFKDKRAVFLAAFDRNREVRAEKLRVAIGPGGTGLERMRKALAFYAEASHGAEGRRGCLIVGSAAELAIFDDEVAQRVAMVLDKNEALFVELIRQGQEDGSIPVDLDGPATARMILCLLQGMRVVGKTGRARDEMAAVVEVAMKALA
jgi:TetR/AcrR family transcriptional repressor of nem operon